MQKNDMAEKKRVLIDGDEIPGLVNFGETVVEKGVIEVPEFKRKRKIQNGVLTIPVINVTYKIARGTSTLQFFRDWFYKDEDHELTIIRTDGTGVEFARTLMPLVENVKYFEPPFDAANPTYAQIQSTLVPWDILPLDAQ